MDLLDSECSSGCESGWTLYFEHSFLSPNNASNSRQDLHFSDGFWKEKRNEEEEEEEEDLSMVSDASSGPPHFIEDEAYSHEDDVHFFHASKSGNRNGKRQKIKEYQCYGHEPSSLLDDTASSPALNLTSNNFTNHASMESFLDFSEGFSACPFEERAAFTEHFGFLQSSLSGNRSQKLQKNQWFEEGKGIGMR